MGRVEEIESLRDDLKKLGAWWQMVFNADKCKVLHFGHNYGQVHYVMNGNILESVEENNRGRTGFRGNYSKESQSE